MTQKEFYYVELRAEASKPRPEALSFRRKFFTPQCMGCPCNVRDLCVWGRFIKILIHGNLEKNCLLIQKEPPAHSAARRWGILEEEKAK